jgi:hypothetical protein
MSAIACAYNIAKLSGRELIVNHVLPDWDFAFEVEDFLESYPFTFYPKTDDRWATYRKLREESYVPYLYTGVLETEQSDKRDELDKMLLVDRPWYIVSGGDFKPFNQSKAEVNSNKAEFYDMIKWRSDIVDKAMPFVRDDYEAVHLRYTDRSHLMPEDSKIQELIDGIDREVFICSDDLEKKSIFMSDKTFTVPYEQIDRTTPEGIEKALVQWIVMSHSKHIHASPGSTFSLEARYPNRLPCTQIGGKPLELTSEYAPLPISV